MFGTYCPTQAMMTDMNGGEWFVRYRYGKLTATSRTTDERIYDKEIGDKWGGILELEEIEKELEGLFDTTEAVKYTMVNHAYNR